MKKPCDDFHVGTKFLGSHISWGPNFSGTKSQGPKWDWGPFQLSSGNRVKMAELGAIKIQVLAILTLLKSPSFLYQKNQIHTGKLIWANLIVIKMTISPHTESWKWFFCNRVYLDSLTWINIGFVDYWFRITVGILDIAHIQDSAKTSQNNDCQNCNVHFRKCLGM